jgi:hypothetical protein
MKLPNLGISGGKVWQKLLCWYVLLLFMMPNDVFSITSLYKFTAPPFIVYNWNSFDFSMLYIPIIFIASFMLFYGRGKILLHYCYFLFMLLLKDILLILTGHSFIIEYGTWEMYLLYIVAIAMLVIVVHSVSNIQGVLNFLWIMVIITMATLCASVALGITPGQYDYVNRYTSTNMAHGETAFVLGIAFAYLLGFRQKEYGILWLVACTMLIVATGARKDLLYVLLLTIFYLFDRSKGKKVKRFQSISAKKVAIYMVVITLISLVMITGWRQVGDRLNLERVENLFTGVLVDSELSEDMSVVGRLSSLNSWSRVIMKNPILGTNFSFYDQQYQMQLEGFPTFAHFTILFNWTIMGILVFIPVVLILKNTIVLIMNNDRLKYLAMYYVLYHIISGGAWSSFKVVLVNFTIIFLISKSAAGYRQLRRFGTNG